VALVSGTKLGAYQIVAALGAGGMGEVYRARDTNLDRDVALKILPEAFATDPERMARLEREAKTLAAVSHSGIAHVYGFHREGTIAALVMELVDGRDLAQVIADGPVPIDEALPIAGQIADALEAAHEKGIVHRDLKPANIKICRDGVVKVLDFGLAKALDPMPYGSPYPGPTASTITTPAMTLHGVILGTAAYMSPEQAKGKPADTRADIWAFGCVLFEMLAGRRAFAGDEMAETLAEIIRGEPQWRLLPTTLPPALDRLLRRCLQKDPRQRLQHIGDARLEIVEAKQSPGAAPAQSVPAPSRTRERAAWGAAIVVAAAIAAVGARMIGPARDDAPPEMRVDITTPPTTSPTSFALSPDGRRIVYAALYDNRIHLWVRALDTASARVLAGTAGAIFPFWSPDGRSVAFFADNKLRRVDLDAGVVQSIASVVSPGGGSWNADGVILFVPSTGNGPILRVAAAGGEPRPVTPSDRHDIGYRFPHFLPDGHHYIYYVAGGPTPGTEYVADLSGGERKKVLSASTPALYANGYLLFGVDDVLFAQRFDTTTLEATGDRIRVTDGIAAVGNTVLGASASRAGPIAYRTGAAEGVRELAWFDRSGRRIGVMGDRGGQSNPSLSRDGRFLAFQLRGDIWVLDVARNVPRRITTDPATDAVPLWSPDGTRVVFNSLRRGVSDLYVKEIDGGPEQVLLASKDDKFACDWTPDGKTLLYRVADPRSGAYDLWALPSDGDRTPYPVVRTPFDDRDGQFSPDGRWVAYQSDESGSAEIYAQRFPGPGRKVRISRDGGTQVRWRDDGKELYFVAPDNSLTAVPVTFGGGIETLEAGSPVKLFATRMVRSTAILRQQYDVSANGQRFLINIVADDASATPITLVLNWQGARR
jgi:eukaryotic-like serine/threonine-protein kinase